MKKRTRRDVIEKAAPEFFGDHNFEVKKNFVEFSVPIEAYEKIKEWLFVGDRLSIEMTSKKCKILILNWREQRAYIARGGGPKDN
ncbi:MAG: hypothetical protein ABSF44_09730 [Candidatus Bathyarchaeia archaeon]|jgi:hypothetical protein